jgi:hypothetical protein
MQRAYRTSIFPASEAPVVILARTNQEGGYVVLATCFGIVDVWCFGILAFCLLLLLSVLLVALVVFVTILVCAEYVLVAFVVVFAVPVADGSGSGVRGDGACGGGGGVGMIVVLLGVGFSFTQQCPNRKQLKECGQTSKPSPAQVTITLCYVAFHINFHP